VLRWETPNRHRLGLTLALVLVLSEMLAMRGCVLLVGLHGSELPNGPAERQS
jgi:hypothetical protein